MTYQAKKPKGAETGSSADGGKRSTATADPGAELGVPATPLFLGVGPLSSAAATQTPVFLQRKPAVGDGPGPSHPGVRIGRSGDAYEREAARVSGAVESGSRKALSPSRVAPDRAGSEGGATQGAGTLHVLLGNPGQGAPMRPEIRDQVEPVLGRSLDDVSVHTGAKAEAAARSVDARAFTHGSDIWLGAGARADDVGLMAHEATHVAQQGGAPTGLIQRDDGDSDTDAVDTPYPQPVRPIYRLSGVRLHPANPDHRYVAEKPRVMQSRAMFINFLIQGKVAFSDDLYAIATAEISGRNTTTISQRRRNPPPGRL